MAAFDTKATAAKSGVGPGSWLRHPAVLCAILAIVTLIVYAPVWENGFVDYDDADYVTANAQIQRGLTWEGIKWAFSTGHASNWHPLTWVSHMLDVQLFGLHPGSHHLVSVGIHVANTLLLFWFLRLTTGSARRSALVAALFALHPLHVESVAWASERKDVLSGFFFLLTLLAYAAYAFRRERVRAGRPWPLFVLALAFLALGLMSKPMLVTVPFLLLLLDYWPLKRLPNTAGGWVRKAAFLAIEKIPFLAIATASSVATFLVQREGGAVSVALTLGQRLANATVSCARYMRKMFWPDDLSVLYPHPGSWPPGVVIFCALLLAAITAWVVLAGGMRFSNPARASGKEGVAEKGHLLVGWFWFVGMMVPVIGVVQVGIQSMADRYTYLPMIGLFIPIVWGAHDSLARRANAATPGTQAVPCAKGAMFATVILILSALCVIAYRQIGFWKNTETLFTRAVSVTKNNYLAWNNLGYYAARQVRVADSMVYYEKSLQIKPDYEDALNNLGLAFAKQRRFQEAIPYYERALRVKPKHVEVHNNLGNALSELGQLDAAMAHYRIALDGNTNHADAHNNLAIALAMKGSFDEAIRHFDRTLEINPKNAGTHSNLGNAYAIQRQFDKAVAAYEKALKLNPDDAQAHNNLGNVLMELGRTLEAMSHYETALKLNPDNPEGHRNLGLALLRLSRRSEAIPHFHEALRLKPGYAEAEGQLKLSP
jgi:tetratricopeptide (TPR) repeat protein